MRAAAEGLVLSLSENLQETETSLNGLSMASNSLKQRGHCRASFPTTLLPHSYPSINKFPSTAFQNSSPLSPPSAVECAHGLAPTSSLTMPAKQPAHPRLANARFTSSRVAACTRYARAPTLS